MSIHKPLDNITIETNRLIPTDFSHESIIKEFRLLSTPLRIKIIQFLRESQCPQSVGAIHSVCQDIAQAHLSQNLITLKKNGILKSERKKTSILYSISDPKYFYILECIAGHVDFHGTK